MTDYVIYFLCKTHSFASIFLWVIHYSVQFSSVLSSHSIVSNSLRPMNRRMPSLSVHHQLKLMSIESVMPSSHLILCRPLLLLPPIPPSIRVFSNESTLCMRWPKYWSFPSASVLPVNTQDCFPLGWTVWISLQSKGLSESSPTPQFKSINSSALRHLHSPTLTSIHDHRKNHSLD